MPDTHTSTTELPENKIDDLTIRLDKRELRFKPAIALLDP